MFTRLNVPFKKSRQKIDLGDRKLPVKRQLFQGEQTTVFLAHDDLRDEDVVVKRTTPQDQDTMDAALKEITVLKKLDHRHIVGFLGEALIEKPRRPRLNIFKRVPTEYEVYLVTDHCRNGTLLDLCNERAELRTSLEEKEILYLMAQVCSALEHLHTRKPKLVHMDVKPENILLCNGNHVKLCDFGSCQLVRERTLTKEELAKEEAKIERFTTPSYRAPELCDLYASGKVCEKVDVWALGCTVYTIVFREYAFKGGATAGILANDYTIPFNAMPHITALIKFLLVSAPSKRPAIGDVYDFIRECLALSVEKSAQSRGTGVGQRPTADFLPVKQDHYNDRGKAGPNQELSKRKESEEYNPWSPSTKVAQTSESRLGYKKSSALQVRLAQRSRGRTADIHKVSNNNSDEISTSFKPFPQAPTLAPGVSQKQP